MKVNAYMEPVKIFLKSGGTTINTVSERIRCAAGVANVISDDAMVLVGGMSRSGTTLLTTVLDAHPEIACGAELLPARIPSITGALCTLDSALAAVDNNFSKVGRYLREHGDRDMGLFFVRCYRAGLTHQEVHDALVNLELKLPSGANLLGERLLVAQTAMMSRATREGAGVYGFKFTSASLDIADAYLPNSMMLCIIRDPRDVVLSHHKRGFKRTTSEISETWKAYARKYRRYEEQHPGRCRVIRYEDLTRQPRRTLMKAFEILPVELLSEVFDFYRSELPIHAGFHPNAERLRMNFSTDGIGRGRLELSQQELKEIESICGEELIRNGYDGKSLVMRGKKLQLDLHKIDKAERKLKSVQFSRRRKFTRYDYANLLKPYQTEYEIMSIGDYVRQDEISGRQILMIRHDIDHDFENGLRIAEWEAERGIRATYCLLHTAWYYGHLEGDRYKHSDMLVEGIFRLMEMGHEINIHNNLVTLALTEDIDPVEVLKRELEFYDSLGVPVTGTSTHGDALCRDLNYRNWEVFEECCDDRFGGPRIVENLVSGRTLSCTLGAQSMFELGLEYEAYDMGKDVYHTESGGNMRTRENTKARRSFGRTDKDKGSVCGILTHPLWWNFG